MKNCKECQKEVIRTYCDNVCQHAFQRRSKVKAFLEGNLVGKIFQIRNWLREYIFEVKGEVCVHCGLSEWYGEPITFDIHHIDGRAANNVIENYAVLCPNCHSQTDNFKNKNSHSDRKDRK